MRSYGSRVIKAQRSSSSVRALLPTPVQKLMERNRKKKKKSTVTERVKATEESREESGTMEERELSPVAISGKTGAQLRFEQVQKARVCSSRYLIVMTD